MKALYIMAAAFSLAACGGDPASQNNNPNPDPDPANVVKTTVQFLLDNFGSGADVNVGDATCMGLADNTKCPAEVTLDENGQAEIIMKAVNESGHRYALGTRAVTKDMISDEPIVLTFREGEIAHFNSGVYVEDGGGDRLEMVLAKVDGEIKLQVGKTYPQAFVPEGSGDTYRYKDPYGQANDSVITLVAPGNPSPDGPIWTIKKNSERNGVATTHGAFYHLESELATDI